MTAKRFILKADYDWWEVLDTTGEIKGEYDDCFSTEEVVDLLNALHEENQKISDLIDKEINELQGQYDFGQEHGFCPMHNIMHTINTLKQLKEKWKND